ncbi:MAG: hypothetical protein RR357_00970 [Clostridia bacterium]
MIKIIDDLYDIAWRLKAIDGDYELFFNEKMQRYEVWARNHLQAVIPYKQLDVRALDYVRETRIERLEILLSEIEQNNANLALSEAKKQAERHSYKIKNLVNYLERGKTKLPSYEQI